MRDGGLVGLQAGGVRPLAAQGAREQIRVLDQAPGYLQVLPGVALARRAMLAQGLDASLVVRIDVPVPGRPVDRQGSRAQAI